MYNQESVENKIKDIFRKSLKFIPPDPDTDLLTEGGLDSLMFVELLAELERIFSIEIPLEDIELDDFRSVSSIARYIINHKNEGGEGEIVPINPALVVGRRNTG